jgi:hypothetical protein
MIKQHGVVIATKNLTESVVTGTKGTVLLIFGEPVMAYELNLLMNHMRLLQS